MNEVVHPDVTKEEYLRIQAMGFTRDMIPDITKFADSVDRHSLIVSTWKTIYGILIQEEESENEKR